MPTIKIMPICFANLFRRDFSSRPEDVYGGLWPSFSILSVTFNAMPHVKVDHRWVTRGIYWTQ